MSLSPKKGSLALLAGFCVFAASATRADDWPMWRHDPSRSAVTLQKLPDELQLQWTREVPPPRPTTTFGRKLIYDRSLEPIVAGQTLIVNSSRTDQVIAIDTRTGEEKWSFFADGPVRLAPVAWEDRIYFVSDDGNLYCLDVADGKLLWKFRGAPSDRRALGNGRLISAWPARGGPVVADGKVWFAAGVWPFTGIFIYCLDAKTGEVIWINEDYKVGINKVAPQGHFVLSGDKLIVPCGRSLPAVFDAKTGKLLATAFSTLDAMHAAWQDRPRAGDSLVTASDRFYLNSGMLVDLTTGVGVDANFPVAAEGVVKGRVLLAPGKEGLQAVDLSSFTTSQREIAYKQEKRTRTSIEAKVLAAHKGLNWPSTTERREQGARFINVLAGDVLYAAGARTLCATRVGAFVEKPERLWEKEFDSWIGSVIAADDRLFVVTEDGRIRCFGADKVEAKTWPRPQRAEVRPGRRMDGCAVLVEPKDVADVVNAAADLDTDWIVLVRDRAKADRLRREVVARELYGDRVHVLVSDVRDWPLPEYMVQFCFTRDEATAAALLDPAVLVRVYRSLRPFGGKLAFGLSRPQHAQFQKTVEDAKLDGAVVDLVDGATTLSHEGAPSGAGTWTHQEGSPGNSRMSSDDLVRPPFSLLWFGGSEDVIHLDRHMLSPRPQVIGGRMFIEAPAALVAVDIYTGRLLWRKDLPDFGKPYYGWQWQPGSTALMGDFASAEDGVYVIDGSRKNILWLDPATGETLKEFETPDTWGTVFVSDDLLIGASQPLDERWVFDFKREPFVGWPAEQTTAFRHKTMAVIKTWKNYEPVPQAEGGDATEAEVEYVLANLNKIISEKGLLAKLPDDVKEKAGLEKVSLLLEALKKLEETPKLSLDEQIRLKRINRELLKRFYPDLPATPDTKGKADTFLGNKFVWAGTASRKLIVMDRHSGKVLWERDAQSAFRHAAIAVGNGRVFAIDKWPRRIPEKGPKELLALDARTGAVVWKRTDDIFGNWLGYSALHDVLIQATGYWMFLEDTEKRIVACRGKNGEPLWRDEASPYARGPVSLHSRWVLPVSGPVLDLLTGKPVERADPLTGKIDVWWKPELGACGGPAVGGEHLLISRPGSSGAGMPLSGGTGFFDLDHPLGVQQIEGFRAGCIATHIPAGGVLNAPNMGVTCECSSSQVDLAVALIHDPDAEAWDFMRDRGAEDLPEDIRRIGINFGAPGDRLDDSGTLWYAVPPPHEVPAFVEPFRIEGATEFYYRPSVRMESDGLKWVAASGVKGLKSLVLPLRPKDKNAKYTVRLHFAEPEKLKAGERLFDVALNGKVVLTDFDVTAEAKGDSRPLAKDFKGVAVSDALVVTLTPKKGTTLLSGVEAAREAD